MTNESDAPYVDAMLERYRRPGISRKAVAASLLAGPAVHAAIVDEIGEAIIARLRSEVSTEFGASDDQPLSAAVAEQWSPWQLRHAQWPDNCLLTIEAMEPGFHQVEFGIRAPRPEDVEDEPCSGRAGIDNLAISDTGENDEYWVWRQPAMSGDWSVQSIARLLIDAPEGLIAEHPEVQSLSAKFVDLARAVNHALSVPSR